MSSADEAPGRPVRLGPFALEAPIAAGGMGLVWRGHAIEGGQAVAVKVITSERARQSRRVEAFRHEVRAVARLSHPGIVSLFDYGVVDPSAERASGGALVAGSPYLAMELADTTLADRATRPAGWPQLRGVILSLLDALAHAHARGVIHRDLKLANVLVFDGRHERGAPPIRVKLTDFGVAYSLDERAPRDGKVTGSPGYMAPEQIRGAAREQGPWTDLYALGCLAYKLASGQMPFEADTTSDLFVMHLEATPPPLAAHFPVPADLGRWLRRLMAKSPQDRYLCAADAARALHRVARKGPRVRSRAREQDVETTAATLTFLDMPTTDLTTAPAPAMAAPEIGEGPDSDLDVQPRLPDDWRSPAVARPPAHLTGAGLGLFGLRAVPLVGREAERDALWALLAEVHAEGRPRVAIIRGPAGVGKSHLARWLYRRALETGGAVGLRASHTPQGSPQDGLGPMVASWLQIGGLGALEIRAQLAQAPRTRSWSAYERAAIAALVKPSQEGFRFAAEGERYAAAHQVLARACEPRPALVWVDDAQWGPDAVELTRLAVRRAALPALFVLTLQDEALEEPGDEGRCAQLLEALCEEAAVLEIALGPLAAGDTARLVDGLLALTPGLSERMFELSGGHPLFAVQLVADWIHRGRLRAAGRGFELAEEVDARALPGDLEALFVRRVEQAAVASDNDAMVALEIAAALGRTFALDEWRAALALEGVAVQAASADLLQRRRLLVGGEGGRSLAFAHEVLRRGFETRARKAGRWSTHNARCVQVLTPAHERGETGVAERIGRHLRAADRHEEAATYLLEGALRRFAGSEYNAVLALLSLREDSLERARIPADTDARWAQGWDWRARTYRGLRRLPDAREWAARADDAAQRAGDPATSAEARFTQAYVALEQGRLHRCERHTKAALAGFTQVQRQDGLLRCLMMNAALASRRGQIGLSDTLAKTAWRTLETHGHPALGANGLLVLGDGARRRRDEAAAAEALDLAWATFEEAMQPHGMGHVLTARGALSTDLGRLEEGLAHLDEAIALHERVGSWSVVMPRAWRALNRLYAGHRSQGVLEELESARALVDRSEAWYHLGMVLWGHLLGASLDSDMERLDAYWADILQWQGRGGVVDIDGASVAERVARALLEQGQERRAEAILANAREQLAASDLVARREAFEALVTDALGGSAEA